jgi:hypothetical protein
MTNLAKNENIATEGTKYVFCKWKDWRLKRDVIIESTKKSNSSALYYKPKEDRHKKRIKIWLWSKKKLEINSLKAKVRKIRIY